jgi:hypothetical protein
MKEPLTYVDCSAPHSSSTETSREYAKRQEDWDYLEIDEPHDCMVTAPAKLASMLATIE